MKKVRILPVPDGSCHLVFGGEEVLDGCLFDKAHLVKALQYEADGLEVVILFAEDVGCEGLSHLARHLVTIRPNARQKPRAQ
jgi:hypothetical protein